MFYGTAEKGFNKNADTADENNEFDKKSSRFLIGYEASSA
jgi:hypothetical protein